MEGPDGGLGDGASAARAFDVFARPFVPESLKIINSLPGTTLKAPAEKIVDFDKLASSLPQRGHLQSLLLSPPPPGYSPTKHSVCPDISFDRYEHYFSSLLDHEIKARIFENSSYNLYAHPATLVFGGQAGTAAGFFTLHVPGVKELAPFVEEDDVIQIRPLNCDSSGRLIQPTGQLASHDGHPWTGVILNGRVTAVRRPEELVTVKVTQFMPSHLRLPFRAMPLSNGEAIELPIRANVQFFLSLERYFDMKWILPAVQHALLKSWPLHTNAWVRSMLFPTEDDSEIQETALDPGVFSRPFFDESLNWEQKKAVDLICSREHGVLPFLISGPPGTGKTKTIIEAALQLVNNVEGISHILLCAPSDPAADTLVERLKTHFLPGQMLRLNRPSRTFQEVSSTILPWCAIEGPSFIIPTFQAILSYRVVVTTCRDAALLVRARVSNADLYAMEHGLRAAIHPRDEAILQEPPKLHWTALLIDEAAQAMEPEAVIPICVVAPPLDTPPPIFTPLVVMAGDEHQLGPQLAPRLAPESETGIPSTVLLAKSLFARLFSLDVYAKHPLARGNYDASYPPELIRSMLPMPRPAFVNLVRNYRSHPAILAVPSALFYNDTLRPEAPRSQISQLGRWRGWQGRKWPVLFRNIQSPDFLEHDGGGWSNLGEAQAAVEYATDLMRSGLLSSAREICVMSPFKSQVRLLRVMMRNHGAEQQAQNQGRRPNMSLWDVDVGPTEAFQGLERTVVILCTTRTAKRFLDQDIARGWGLVGLPPNMLNVVLTRAKAGLIILGSRAVLETDENWRAMLAFCDRNGLVSDPSEEGKAGPRRGAVLDVMRRRLEQNLVDEEESGGFIS
jgi:DNA polymerase III delta prime subunit